jgi:hypothetical protein
MRHDDHGLFSRVVLRSIQIPDRAERLLSSASFSSAATAPTGTPGRYRCDASSAASPRHCLPNLERTLVLHGAFWAVLVLLARGAPGMIIHRADALFDGNQSTGYASAVGHIVDAVRAWLEEAVAGCGDTVRTARGHARGRAEHKQDEVKTMRIYTERHRIMITPVRACARRHL